MTVDAGVYAASDCRSGIGANCPTRSQVNLASSTAGCDNQSPVDNGCTAGYPSSRNILATTVNRSVISYAASRNILTTTVSNSGARHASRVYNLNTVGGNSVAGYAAGGNILSPSEIHRCINRRMTR